MLTTGKFVKAEIRDTKSAKVLYSWAAKRRIVHWLKNTELHYNL